MTLSQGRNIVCMIIFSFMLGGCLAVKEEASTVSAREFFAGAISATNLGGAIKVSWNAPSEPVAKYKIYLVDTQGGLSYLDSVDANKTAYTHSSGVEKTKTYSYIVKAVDTTGAEDANKVIVTSFLFGGIVSVYVTGRTTASISLPGDSGAFDKIRIYGTTPGSVVKKLLKEVDRGIYNVDLTGLRPGVTYTFSAAAYNSSLAQEDGNELTLPARLQSYSFDGTDYRYRGVMSVMAFGEAPNAPYDAADPKRVPKDRLVRLTYLPFSTANGATKYKIVRTLKNAKLDISTTTQCTSTTDTSCWVCDNLSGPDTCDDVNVAAPPKRYDYAISQYFTDGTDSWVEELPEVNSEFRVTVAIPPRNMVLTNRDAANYEMCDILGRASDPKNHQRCEYTGIGAVPFNSGPERPTALNLTYGYYDFGYNLFVDRWELACNWTRAADGGKCGAGATDGNCIGNSAPSNTIGKNGDVFYETNGDWAWCNVKQAGTWTKSSTFASWSASTLASLKVVTSDPGPVKKLGPVEHLSGTYSTNNPTNLCASMTTEYGLPKRMMRMREWRATAAWPRFSKEPYSMSQTTSNDLEAGTWSTPGSCLTQNATADNALVSSKIPADLNELINGSLEFLTYKTSPTTLHGKPHIGIGSFQTSKCISRYGAQDMVGNTNELVADILSCTAPLNNCVSATADTGNKDFIDVAFDGVTVWMPHSAGNYAYSIPSWGAPPGTGSGAWIISDARLTSYFNATPYTYPGDPNGKLKFSAAGNGPTFDPVPYVNPTLGLPMMQNDYGNAIPISSFKFNNTADQLFSWVNKNATHVAGFALGGYQNGGGAGRWKTEYDQWGGEHTARCAQSAE